MFRDRRTVASSPVLALLLGLCVSSNVDAQQQPRTTGTTPTPAGTTGGGTGGGVTVGGATGSAGGMSLGGAGGQAGDLTGLGGQQPQFRTFQDLRQSQEPSGFIGRRGADEFIGRQFSGQQPSGGAFAATGGGTFGPQFGGFAGNRRQITQGTGRTATRSRAERLRPRHRIAFSFSQVDARAVDNNLQSQFRPLQSQGRIANAQFSLSADGTLTLRGTAASIEDRELAAAVARLEPGVRRVENAIVVQESSADTPSPSPGLSSSP